MKGNAIFRRFSNFNGKLLLCFLAVIMCGSVQITADGGERQTNKLAFDLEEVSAFDLGRVSSYFRMGQFAASDDSPNRNVKYPEFKSNKVLHGSVYFAGKTAQQKTRPQYHYAIDESAGTGGGYDRLYFDLNADRDLTNDKPLTSMDEPPKGALFNYSSTEQEVCFNNFEIIFDFGAAGQHTVGVMPHLIIPKTGSPQFHFTATKVHKGLIDIDGARYYAVLGDRHSVGGPLDQPGTSCYLIPEDKPDSPAMWWGGNMLNATHLIGSKFYRLSTTPTGNKLFVEAYDGKLGTFEVGAGGRDIKNMTIRGSLTSENTSVAVGGKLESGWPAPAQNCRVPVGDYYPRYLRITYGNLNIFLSNNYHADGQPRKSTSQRVCGIKIRENKPFVFDFSNKPEVLFASPAKNHRVKIGQQLQVKAVLIDPEQDFMIRGLEDLTRKQKEEIDLGDGKKRTIERQLSLDPKVVITRTDGEKIAEGVMPFG